jgi:hypothetical protein
MTVQTNFKFTEHQLWTNYGNYAELINWLISVLQLIIINCCFTGKVHRSYFVTYAASHQNAMAMVSHFTLGLKGYCVVLGIPKLDKYKYKYTIYTQLNVAYM